MRSLTWKVAALGIAVLGMTAAARPAFADEAGDLLLNYNATTQTFSVIGKTPETVIFDRPLEQFGSLFINDTGFDMAPSIDNDTPYVDDDTGAVRNIRQATLEQVSISPGLSAVYAFDGTTPVFGTTSATGFKWTQAETKPPATPQALHSDVDDPLYLHQHFTFTAVNEGKYDFFFRYTNVVLTNGTQISSPTPTYHIIYTTPGFQGAAAPEPTSGALLAGTVLPLGAAVLKRRRQKNTAC